jgi:hypothetical protein
VEMFQSIDCDEEVTEEIHLENKKRKYSRKNTDLFGFHQLLILPLYILLLV